MRKDDQREFARWLTQRNSQRDRFFKTNYVRRWYGLRRNNRSTGASLALTFGVVFFAVAYANRITKVYFWKRILDLGDPYSVFMLSFLLIFLVLFIASLALFFMKPLEEEPVDEDLDHPNVKKKLPKHWKNYG